MVIRLTKQQLVRIHEQAEAKGYLTLSAYVRDMALEPNLSLELNVQENTALLREIISLLTYGKKPHS